MPSLTSPEEYRVTMKVWTRPGHSITRPDDPEYEVEITDTYREIMVYLWTLAKKANPEWAQVLLPGQYQPTSNFNLRGTKPPLSIAEDVEAMTRKLNAEELTGLVVEGLNSVWDELQQRMADPLFSHTIAEAARQWANDCYQ